MRRPDQAGRERADARAKQRDADEVRGNQDQRADNSAEQRREHHPERVLGPHRGAGEERAEDEAVDPQDDAEDPIPGEARDEAAREQDDRRGHLQGRGEHEPMIIVRANVRGRTICASSV